MYSTHHSLICDVLLVYMRQTFTFLLYRHVKRIWLCHLGYLQMEMTMKVQQSLNQKKGNQDLVCTEIHACAYVYACRNLVKFPLVDTP